MVDKIRALKGLTWRAFIDRAFWVLILYLGHSVANDAEKIRDNIQALNEKMGVVITTQTDQKQALQEQDGRLRDQETRVRALEISCNRFAKIGREDR
jgi:hypothetical protein